MTLEMDDILGVSVETQIGSESRSLGNTSASPSISHTPVREGTLPIAAHTHTHTHTHTHRGAHTHTHTHTHRGAHTHTHTHTHRGAHIYAHS
jgi:hypothetical protein